MTTASIHDLVAVFIIQKTSLDPKYVKSLCLYPGQYWLEPKPGQIKDLKIGSCECLIYLEGR